MSWVEIINMIQWLASIATLFLIIYVNKFHHHRAVGPVMGFLICNLLWSSFAALILSVDALETEILLNRIKMLGPIFLPYFVLKISVSTSSEIKVPTIIYRSLLFVSFFYAALILSPYHELMITNYGLKTVLGSSVLTYMNGDLFTIYNAIARFVLISSFFILMFGMKNRNYNHKKSNALILLSFLIPFVCDHIGVYFVEDLRFLQLVPIAFTFTSAILVYLLFKQKLLEVAPYARSKIVESLRDPCLMWGADGKLVDCNKSASEILSLSTNLKNFDDQSFPALKNNNHELALRESIYRVNYQRITLKNGKPEGAFTILVDITEEKKLAMQMQKLDELKSSLLGILSHDLTGHIGQLSFISEILSKDLEKLSPTEREELSNNLGVIAQDVRVFIQEILNWSKSQNGDTKTFDVAELLKKVLEFMEPFAKTKDIEIKLINNEKVKIKKDEVLTAVVFRNILYNAIKHSEERSVVNISLDGDALLVSNPCKEDVSGRLNRAMNDSESVLSGGLGLKLIREFSNILNMNVSFRSYEDTLTARITWS